jgi:hypothetical protein
MSDATSQKQDQILENQEASCGPWARGGRRSVTSTLRPRRVPSQEAGVYPGDARLHRRDTASPA